MRPLKERAVIEAAQRWLGNPISRALLHFVYGWKRGEDNRLDIAIRRYAGENVPADFQDKIISFLVKFVMDRGSDIFGYPRESLKKSLKDPVVRRGIVNILGGIARYGAHRPFISKAPLLVVWNYTRLCNLRCGHCYANAGPESAKDELTTQEAKRIIDEFEDAGVVALAFSGGEPLMRKDIFEVASYAKEGNFFTSVATNGTLITRRIAKGIKEAFDYVEISLDGFEEIHDRFRGAPGAWQLACKGIKNCVMEGVDTCIALTATRYNLSEIPRLIDFAEKNLGVKRFIVFNYIPVGKAKEMVDQDLDPHDRHELLKHLYTRMVSSDYKLFCYSTAPQYSVISWEFVHESCSNRIIATHFATEASIKALRGKTKSLAEFIGGCGAGRIYCGLEPNGDITPCVFMPIKLGNMKKDRLLDVWDSSEVLSKLRIREELKGCGDCKYLHICGGCRARAYSYYGDVQAPDPGCIHNLKYWKEIRGGEGFKFT